ncbi:hypothetical protein EGR_11165 [Echinococcus granulosus]|uniref:Uncharacterized protein n=1 Tax=Echinococcus granulosus TaxID=6210 RepID=W6U6M5_ECHGR|nr:hypothetical protein EGR_11165 [Echinococcus granulosus]EUB53977.1 hypothetical protein EGR_11165 [Echinococcus granulosus]
MTNSNKKSSNLRKDFHAKCFLASKPISKVKNSFLMTLVGKTIYWRISAVPQANNESAMDHTSVKHHLPIT